MAIDVSTTGVASIKEFTNSDFLSDCATLGSGTWQTIAVIPGLSPLSAQVDERASYARFQIYDYSQIINGGEARELIEFNISRFANYGQIQLLNHDLSQYNSSAPIKIEKIRIQHGKVSIGGGSVWSANIQLYRSNNCNNNSNAETDLFVKMTDQIPLTETPLVIIPMELTSTPLSLTNIMTDEISILNNTGDEVNDADSDPGNEIQDLSLTNNTLSLSSSNQDVNLSTYLQELSLNSTNSELLISGSNSVDLSLLNKWDRNNPSGYVYPTNISDKVGIGTSSPSAELDIVGVIELSNVAPTDPGTNIVRLGDGGSNLQIQTNYGYTKIGPQNTTWCHFYTDRPRYFFDKGLTVDGGLIGSYNEDLSIQTSGTTRMTVEYNNGYIGIGTNTPDSKLHIKELGSTNEGTVPGITFPQQHFKLEGPSSEMTMGSNEAWNWIKSSNNFPLKILGGKVDIDNGGLNVKGSVAIGSSFAGTYNAPSDGMLVQGRVGLNTSSVDLETKLQVNGRIYVNGNSDSYEGAGILLGGWGSGITGGDIAVVSGEALNFGYDQVAVNGGFIQRFKMGSNGYVTFYNGHGNSSDRRLKTNIMSLENSLDKILSLQGVSYNYISEYNNLRFDSSRKSIGFIAQDLEKVFPEIVRTDEDGLKSVEYQLLNAAIVEAIKEQQTTIETLNDKLENQQNQINELNRIINRITKDD